MSLKDKSKENFKIARWACTQKCFNSAASRLYYSLYQACVGELQEHGRTVKNYDIALAESLAKQGTPAKWPHSIIAGRGIQDQVLSLNHREQEAIRNIRKLRERGDYWEDSIEGYEIEVYFEIAPKILEGLGVNVET